MLGVQVLKWQNGFNVKTERGQQSVQPHELNARNVNSAMECFIVVPSDIDRESWHLTLRDGEAHHAVRSLRLHVGDELLASDLVGSCYRCRIHEITSAVVTCTIEEVLPNFGESARKVTLLIAMLSQPARWEFVLEKSTELGVSEIYPLQTERTERLQLRRERSEKILRAALKQTKRARMPVLHNISDYIEALSKSKKEDKTILLLHESTPVEHSLIRALEQGSEKSIAIAVGPEGGFSEEEVALARDTFGAKIVSLGTRRLRAETAAIAALAIAMSL